jgi:hypothetical protein
MKRIRITHTREYHYNQPSHEEASPLSGSWAGPADAFEKMEVSVQVVAFKEEENP